MMMLMKSQVDLYYNKFYSYIEKRSNILNANSGHEKIGCIVYTNLKHSCVLHGWL